MDWITDAVAIGNFREARDAALLARHAFRSAVSLDGTLDAADAEALGLAEVAAYRLIDGPGNDVRLFRRAVADLARLAAAHPPVLVQCHAGRSRSVAVVAGYLMGVRGVEPDKAVAAVAARRAINVTPELVELLYRL